jgi:RNA polymerase sigma factor (sigma-70 family)
MQPLDNPHHAHDALTDELLAVRCQLGEPEAFDALVQRWHAPLCRYVTHLLGRDDVMDDVVQDAWLRVLRALPALRDARRFRAWLFGIARRSAMDQLRRRYAEPNFVPVEDAHGAESDEEDDALSEALSFLQERLLLLPVTEREVLDLFYLQGLTLAQIAEVCDVPVGTVKSRLFRARQLLRHELRAPEPLS